MNIKEIESPLSAFNNIQIEITHSFEQIIFSTKKTYKHNKYKSLLSMNNLIIFDNNTITLMGYLKLLIINDELMLKTVKPLSIEDLEIVNNIYKNWDKVSLNFFKFIQMYNMIANNYDDVPYQLTNNIIKEFNKSINKIDYEIGNFLIPFKTKIALKYDDDKKYIENIYNRYQYILKIRNLNKNYFEYLIIRVLSSELNENKNELNNLRYLEQDVIKKSTLKNNQINNFIIKLFNYGEIIN
jgi:hypothetical protein